VLASSASVLIGVGLVNTIRPGEGFILPQFAESANLNVQKIQQNVIEAKPPMQALLEIIPKNPIEAATKAFDGEMLALMFFSLIFGVALCKQNTSVAPPKMDWPF
jgi:DAACS family dicarboxylate/amino acid:cation (Na+ or H+) symporter